HHRHHRVLGLGQGSSRRVLLSEAGLVLLGRRRWAPRRWDLSGWLARHARMLFYSAADYPDDSGKRLRSQSTMSCSGVPGVNISSTPRFLSAVMSSSGMMPPPKTMMSVALRRFNSSTTAGNSVMCAPEWMERP